MAMRNGHAPWPSNWPSLAKLANGLAAAGSSITELRKGDGRACGDAGKSRRLETRDAHHKAPLKMGLSTGIQDGVVAHVESNYGTGQAARCRSGTDCQAALRSSSRNRAFLYGIGVMCAAIYARVSTNGKNGSQDTRRHHQDTEPATAAERIVRQRQARDRRGVRRAPQWRQRQERAP